MSYTVTHFAVDSGGPMAQDNFVALCNSPNKNARLVWAREVVTCKRCNRRLREGFLDKEPRVGGRKQIVMQLPIALIDAIRRRAFWRTAYSGKHVPQQQIVEEILSSELL
jgi:hypothetical protein